MAVLWTYSFQVCVFLVLRAPEEDAVLQVGSHKTRATESPPSPCCLRCSPGHSWLYGLQVHIARTCWAFHNLKSPSLSHPAARTDRQCWEQVNAVLTKVRDFTRNEYCWVITLPCFQFHLKVHHYCSCFAYCLAVVRKKKKKKIFKKAPKKPHPPPSSPIAENAVKSRVIGDKQCKYLMARRKSWEDWDGWIREKIVCIQHDVVEVMTQTSAGKFISRVS